MKKKRKMKRRKEGNEFERPSPPPSSSSSSSVIETTRNDVFNIYILLFFLNRHSFNKNISLSERGKIADTLDYVD